ncbi:MAG: hypothetical protein K8F90_01625 [Hyphomicrobiales bacterium]|nr:hypothetical protein [Hyphomicrobiales bacterium]
MRKLTERHKLWIIRHSNITLRKRFRRLALKSQRDQHNETKQHLGELKVEAPPVFSLSENYEDVVEYVNRIRSIGFGRRQKGIRKVVDFSTIKELEPAAALVLAAEIDRWRRIGGFRPRPHKLEKWDTEVFLQFYELGLFSLLLDTEVHAKESPTVTWIPFKFGRGESGFPADQFLSNLTEIAGPIPERTIFYAALVEALLNVRNHAYLSENKGDYACQPIFGGWWIAGAFDNDKRELTGLVFDQGLGIPKTLPRSALWEQVRGQLIGTVGLGSIGLNDDARLIQAAIEVSRTRTNLQHRGFGLTGC